MKRIHIYAMDRKRFYSFVEKGNGECWLWRGKLRPKGYGAFNLRGYNISAHKAALLLFGIKYRKGKVIVHRCDVKHCVNPEHLQVMTSGKATRRALKRKAKRGTRK